MYALRVMLGTVFIGHMVLMQMIEVQPISAVCERAAGDVALDDLAVGASQSHRALCLLR